LSHELKNPLVAIKTFAQMLPLKYDDEEFRTSFSGIMQAEVQKINEIIDRINKLADSMELKPASVDLVGLFHGKIKELENRNGVRFNINGSERMYVPVDAEKLKEAVGYIFDFIYEDTAGSGEARICFDSTDSGIEITIVENGRNISLNNAEDCFVPFNSVTRSPVSIGMMLARKILESHGGSFRCVPAPSAKNLVITLPAKGENG
jgi:nitrogen fixation/metabolism regulation signal transduction histidine kinase